MAGFRVWGAVSIAAVVIVALGSRPVQGMSPAKENKTAMPLSEGANVEASSEPVREREGLASDDESRKRAALASFQEARRLFLLEQYAAAARQFRRSYDILPSLEALLAAARAYDRAGANFEAIDTYDEYLEFEDEDALRHAKAVRRLRELRAELGVVVLRVAEPEKIAELILNGEVVVLDNFPRSVLPGQVSLAIRHVGVEGMQVIESAVGSGETTVLEVLPRMPLGPPKLDSPQMSELLGDTPEQASGEPPAVAGRRILRAVLWTGGGLTGAAGLVVAVLGGMTMRQGRTYRAGLCALDDGVCAEGSTYPYAAEARFVRLKRGTNVAIGVGVGLAVTTLVVATIVHKGRVRSGTQLARHRRRGLRFFF